jgi:hypothetical protein
MNKSLFEKVIFNHEEHEAREVLLKVFVRFVFFVVYNL